MLIFPLKYRDFSSKIHSGDFSIAILKNFNEDLSIGDFSLKNSFGDFRFEDLFMEIFPLEYGLGDFSF